MPRNPGRHGVELGACMRWNQGADIRRNTHDSGAPAQVMLLMHTLQRVSSCPRILSGPIRNRVLQPLVVTARRDLKHRAHHLNRILVSVRFNEW